MHQGESVQAEDQDVRSAYDSAHVQLLAGRFAQARRTATEALTADGPSARLYLVLGQAHAAEDDDDHDDRAEAAYREGLKAFPDDLDLLAAYAELCLRSDYMDRPARHRRGPELDAQLRELAPGSPQALRIEQISAGKAVNGPRPPSPVRTQTHDARLVLAAVGDPVSAAAQARAHAQSRPDDNRLATVAETLTALARPGRAPLRWMVRFPQHTLLIRAALCVVVLLAVPALHWNSWARMAVVVTVVPTALLQSLLRRARHRAGTRPSATHAEPVGVPDFPVLPPVPAASSRETAVAVLALATVMAALVGSGIWGYEQYAAYPRYTFAAPERVQGYERLEDTSLQQFLEGVVNEDTGGSDATTFTYVYGKRENERLSVITVFGAVGDFHEMTPDALGSIQDGLRSGLTTTGLAAGRVWSADPGRLGGSLRCLSYDAIDNQRLTACTWGDKGSFGTVVSPDSGAGHEAAADLTRAVREAVLHQGTPADSV
ncbi:hypothetical protein [Streptomyces sp. NPDC057072]|uniref:hypothetical protein n=1 Tax=unclassified Streptomyces TaxID=2593676 RepID=UPI0036412F81